MDDLGLRPHIDLVVGSSAGAMNGCYFLAGQAHPGVGIYVDYLTGSVLPHRLVSLARVHKIMDIDWLVDVVLRAEVALDVPALRSAPARMLMTASNLHTGEPALFDEQNQALFEVLRASAALPVLYGRCPQVAGTRYADGGLTAPIPVAQAVAAGATDALILSPSVRGHRRENLSLLAFPERVNRGMALAEGLTVIDGVQISCIFASPDVEVERAKVETQRAHALWRTSPITMAPRWLPLNSSTEVVLPKHTRAAAVGSGPLQPAGPTRPPESIETTVNARPPRSHRLRPRAQQSAKTIASLSRHSRAAHGRA